MRREKAALVVEGYTDVLMLYQSGIKNAVATLGTAMTEQHLKTLSGHAEKIYLLFDPDEAGERAVERVMVTAAELRLDLKTRLTGFSSTPPRSSRASSRGRCRFSSTASGASSAALGARAPRAAPAPYPR
jgi:hypothetical protein